MSSILFAGAAFMHPSHSQLRAAAAGATASGATGRGAALQRRHLRL